MPQATDQDRERYKKMFHTIDAGPGIKLLVARGYTLTKGWEWLLPEGQANVKSDENDVIWFLIDEWDFGGVVSHAPL